VVALNDRLEDVLRGIYDRGRKPDKVPRLLKGPKPPVDWNAANSAISSKKGSSSIGPIGFNGNRQNVKVLQIINIHKADSLFRKLETNGTLAKVVAQLAGWKMGARLAQDQVWAKSPGAPPLVFHRDSPYFMFEPPDVVTVWCALDDMDADVGPLEYVKGSHTWGDGRVGSAQHFFQSNVKSLLKSAAERQGLNVDTLNIVSMAGLKAGGLSIHHGKIWHGSGRNNSATRPRRGLGMHFVPANVKFTNEAANSSIWKSYVSTCEDPSTVELSEEDFPLSY
jgi:ectoine hydroxylase-related dioxygenase (phytanoyl-CoA dioxygenase family)